MRPEEIAAFGDLVETPRRRAERRSRCLSGRHRPARDDVHGLCETDDASKLRTDRHLPYGVRVRSELGYTPLYVRYNTGRHVSENGRELRQSLFRLRDPQPRP
jgi:hypothetical protein